MSHGHDDHGHAAQASAGAAHTGPVEIPPEPPVRTISPAKSDLPFPLPLPGILWPVVWLGVAGALFWAAGRSKGEVLTAHEHGAEHGGEHAPEHR